MRRPKASGEWIERYRLASALVQTRGMVASKRVRARRVEPRAASQPGDDLAPPDYVDSFEIAVTASPHPAERWARAIFEGAPPVVRWTVLIGWNVLGFRLEPKPSGSHVLGWRIAEETSERIVLSVESSVLGRAQLVTNVEDVRVELGTAVWFSWRGASALWSVVGPIHRRILPYLLTHAATTKR